MFKRFVKQGPEEGGGSTGALSVQDGQASTDVTGSAGAQVDAATLAEAKVMGWVPEDKWKGKGPWVDAATFVEKGRVKLPILNARVQSLTEENARLKNEVKQVVEDTRHLSTMAYNEAKANFDAQVAALKAQRVAAVADGDGVAFQEAEDALTALNANAPKPPKAVTAPAGDTTGKPGEAVTPPEIQEWIDANPWYVEGSEAHTIAQAQALAIAQISARKGTPLVGRALADKVSAYMAEHHPDLVGTPPPSGHEGGDGQHAQLPRNGSAARTFDNLPADVKAQFSRNVERKLVGMDRATNKQTPEAIAKAKANYVAHYDWG